MNIDSEKKYMTIKEFAQSKNITRQTVYNWIKEGKLKTKRLGNQQFITEG